MTEEEKALSITTGFIKVTTVGGFDGPTWISINAITGVVEKNDGFEIIGLGPRIKVIENPLELIAAVRSA